MSFLGMRSTGWLRALGLAVIAGALVLATGVASGSLSGNSPSFTTNAPDPISARVVINGANNGSGGSTNEAEFQICFDKQIQTIGGGGASFINGPNGSSAGGLELYAYGAGETGPVKGRQYLSSSSFSTPGPSSYTYTASAASNPSNPNCVNVTITPTSAGEPGVDLNGFTEVGVTEGVATGLSGLPSTPATVGLDPVGTPEVAPRAGATAGAQITSIIKSPASPTTLTYVFDYLLDPNSVTAGNFCYYDSSGAGPGSPNHCGSSATVSGNQVTVQFGANVNNDVYYEVFPGAVFTQTTKEANPGTALGGTIASVPTLRSVAKVPGVAGAYDLTYDQCVVSVNDSRFVAVLEDNTVVGGAVSSRPSSDCTKIRITFGSVANFADYASKVVLIGDTHGAVQQNSSPNHNSAVSGAPVNTAPMQEGFTNGPNLIGFSLDRSNATATYFFDNQYGALAHNTSSIPNISDFGLIYKDGTNSLDSQSYGQGATFTGPNQVTVQFNPNQLGTASNPAVAGVIGTSTEAYGAANLANHAGDCPDSGHQGHTGEACDGDDAVWDYQTTDMMSPEASAVGMGGPTNTTSTSTTTSTVSSTTTSHTTTTTRVTTTTTVHPKPKPKHKKCPKGKVRRHGKCVKKHKKHKKHKK